MFYNVANILVKPTAAESNVCPTPQNIAYKGCIWILDARYTNAMVALLTIPELSGANIPTNKMNKGKNL